MKRVLALILIITSISGLRAQNLVKRNDTIIVIENEDTLRLPWASGLNAAQTGNIDLDLDGVMDLLMFEQNNEANYDSGDKMLPFLNKGSSHDFPYEFAPDYRWKFPYLENYCILKDWNCDGKTDIFTWDLRQRITAYRNVSDTELKFFLEKQILSTDTSGLPNNNPGFYHSGEILWAFFDMPSFEDIDGDGDLDILTTATNGHYIEYNKNMSMEKYGHCDSLVYELKNTCWGYFFEDTGTVILDTCDLVNVTSPESTKGGGGSTGPKSGSRHSSDALLALDIDGDGDKDLLAGDAAETGVYSFRNGGRKDSSHITSYTTGFPPVDSFNSVIYGLPFHVDGDFDGEKDLVITVGLDRLNDINGIWYYKNTGNASNPNFVLQTRSFMQEYMIDVGTQSKPVFFDYNGDSLMDMIIGNLGYFTELAPQWIKSRYVSQLALYENVGTKQLPVFDLVDSNFANLDTMRLNLKANKPSYGYHPTFGDLDGDGDEDMIIGDYRGKVHLFLNVPNNGKAEFYLAQAEFQSIDVGGFSTPQLFDLDEDGKLDLIIGEEVGNLNYYRNNTNGNLSFVLADDSLGDINVKDSWDWVGYSSPYFFKDSLGVTKLLSGTKSGYIRYYDSIIVGDSISNKFRKVEESYQDLWDGIFSTIHGADIDDDGQPDFILGNQSGGVSLYTSEDSIYIPGVEEIESTEQVRRKIYPNPAKNEVTIDIMCECQDEFEYTVYNILGDQVDKKFGLSKFTFDISRYDAGMFVIRAENKKRSIIITERFIKME